MTLQEVAYKAFTCKNGRAILQAALDHKAELRGTKPSAKEWLTQTGWFSDEQIATILKHTGL